MYVHACVNKQVNKRIKQSNTTTRHLMVCTPRVSAAIAGECGQKACCKHYKERVSILYSPAALVDLTDHLKMSSQRGFDSDCELMGNNICNTIQAVVSCCIYIRRIQT